MWPDKMASSRCSVPMKLCPKRSAVCNVASRASCASLSNSAVGSFGATAS
ncbi:Uncharacterised protein [Mycobacteroides abscessus subsp. abscessus]|nr:Uncharacterised protein [Mycobacteroides abscessus subsp. abscessus]